MRNVWNNALAEPEAIKLHDNAQETLEERKSLGGVSACTRGLDTVYTSCHALIFCLSENITHAAERCDVCRHMISLPHSQRLQQTSLLLMSW